MVSLSVSQAQRQFTSILSDVTTIVDRKSNVKKAVLLPYDVYERLIAKSTSSAPNLLDDFVGILSQKYETDDERYNEVLK